MNKFQIRSAIIGTILGDSSLCGKTDKYIMTGHSPKQLTYLKTKQSLFNSYCNVRSTLVEAKGMKHPFYRLWTTSHHKYTALYNLIYIDGKKRITPKLLSKFDEVGLAYLFMDDGCKESVYNAKYETRTINSYKFCLNSFPIEDVQLVSDWLFEKYSIESKVYLERKKHPILKIQKKIDKEKFKNLINQYITEDSLYKLYI